MDKFEILFGIKKPDVKENCILMPFATKYILQNIGIPNLIKGKIYSSANTSDFTIIQTGMGPGFAGDAMLYLKDTACKNVILFGSCGLVGEKDGLSPTRITMSKSVIPSRPASGRLGGPLNSSLSIGSLVSPSKCYSYESFSSTLLNPEAKEFYPDKTLFEKLIHKNNEIKSVTCATVSSLKLEEENLDLFENKNIDVFDMECSAIFCAGKYARIRTTALFYVSDIINSKPFYMDMDPDLKLKISNSVKKAIDNLIDFMKSKD